MAVYVNQITIWFQFQFQLKLKLRGTGFNIDEWIGSLIVAGLPNKFSPLIMAIEHLGITIITDSIKNKLLDVEFDNGNGNGSVFILVNLLQINVLINKIENVILMLGLHQMLKRI